MLSRRYREASRGNTFYSSLLTLGWAVKDEVKDAILPHIKQVTGDDALLISGDGLSATPNPLVRTTLMPTASQASRDAPGLVADTGCWPTLQSCCKAGLQRQRLIARCVYGYSHQGNTLAWGAVSEPEYWERGWKFGCQLLLIPFRLKSGDLLSRVLVLSVTDSPHMMRWTCRRAVCSSGHSSRSASYLNVDGLPQTKA